MSTEKTDMWSLGATILQFILDTSVWDVASLVKKFDIRDSTLAIKKVRIDKITRIAKLQKSPDLLDIVNVLAK